MTEPTGAKELKGKTGLKRLIDATRYSKDGLVQAFKSEEAFRQELILSAIGCVLLFFIPAPLTLKLIALFSLVFVLVTELLNSAVEAAIDRIGQEIHPLSKFAKDAGSCAVLLSLVFAAVAWLCLLWSAFCA